MIARLGKVTNTLFLYDTCIFSCDSQGLFEEA